MVACALRGEALPVYGDGLQRREWVYVKDNCAAIELVLERGQIGASYAIGGTKEIENLELVQCICSHLDTLAARGKSYAEQITFVTDRLGHDRRYALDDSRIRAELGWRPEAEFPKALGDTVRWYLDHPERHSN